MFTGTLFGTSKARAMGTACAMTVGVVAVLWTFMSVYVE
jgi:hypothetical protein